MEAFSDYLETIKTLIDQVRDEESPKVAEIADLLAEQVLSS